MTICLTDLMAKVFNDIGQGVTCGALFLDLQKAFDTVNHLILLSKLKLYGLPQCALSWIKSFLEGQRQVSQVGHFRRPTGSFTSPFSVH